MLGLVILGGLFCAYWFGAALGLRSQQANLADRGVQVADIAVTGFPLNFDVSLDQPALPARGWSAQWLRVKVPAWWPFRATGMVPGAQTLRLRGVDWTSAGADISFSVQTGPSLTVKSARLTVPNLRVSRPGFAATLAQADLALAPADTPVTRTLSLSAARVDLPTMPIRDAVLNAVLIFDRAPGLRGRGQVQKINLRSARFDWGDTRVAATGQITRRADARLDGEIILTLTGWRGFLDRLRSTGLLPSDQAPMVQMMAQNLSAGDSLTLPLTLVGSVLRLGPFALFDLGRF